MKLTIYYYAETNSRNFVIATDGTIYYECPLNSDGIDINSGIDLFQDDGDGNAAVAEIVEQLKQAYANIDGLYSMDEIKTDFPDSVYPFSENDYETLTEIITVRD